MEICSRCNAKIIKRNYCSKCGLPLRKYNKIATKVDFFNWEPIKSIVNLYALLLLLILFFGSVDPTGSGSFISYSITYSAIFVGLMVYINNKKVQVKKLYKFNITPVKETLISVAIVASTIVITLLLLSLIYGILKEEALKTTSIINANDSLILNIIAICLLPAIVEELAFRGIIQTQLHTILSPKQTIIATAFTFELLHLRFISLPPFIISLILSYTRYKTKSLWLPMILHFTYNLSLVLYFYYKFNLY